MGKNKSEGGCDSKGGPRTRPPGRKRLQFLLSWWVPFASYVPMAPPRVLQCSSPAISSPASLRTWLPTPVTDYARFAGGDGVEFIAQPMSTRPAEQRACSLKTSGAIHQQM